MRTLLCLAILITSQLSLADSSPCAGINRELSSKDSDSIAGPVAKQLKKEIESVESVTVLESYRLKNWQILKVDTKVSDEVYLFYSASPLKKNYISMWSGAAKVDETEQINNWVRTHVKGIPQKLRKCFSWHVTKENKS